jgi:hypothetical protein
VNQIAQHGQAPDLVSKVGAWVREIALALGRWSKKQL